MLARMIRGVKIILTSLTLFLVFVLLTVGDWRGSVAVGVMGFLMLGDFILIEKFVKAIVNQGKQSLFSKVIFFLKLLLIIVIILPLYKFGWIDPPYLFVGVGLLPLAIILSYAFVKEG